MSFNNGYIGHIGPLRKNEADAIRRKNNPKDEPTGHYTGRCSKCGSNDLWDDNLAYGCNRCGAILYNG